MGPTTRVKDTIDRVLTDFGAYPMTIFGTAGAWLLTFLLPLAFMAYLPAALVLDHTEELVVPLWLAQLSPVVGPLVLVGGIAVFRHLFEVLREPRALSSWPARARSARRPRRRDAPTGPGERGSGQPTGARAACSRETKASSRAADFSSVTNSSPSTERSSRKLRPRCCRRRRHPAVA